ncbi:MAG: AbrB/MazE/SpoVT family DNA-binding domain-containing protein, partial [Clostridia bacterium]|nr:AbrB/MazE/SpoVT family DNA-binding domain-containing protein [Clostridia bacterium]
MKSTGIVRRIDQLGRITIPMETRNILGIKENDSLEIFTEDNMIL